MFKKNPMVHDGHEGLKFSSQLHIFAFEQELVHKLIDFCRRMDPSGEDFESK